MPRDLLFLRDRLRAPLEFDPARNGYRYTDATYQLPFFRLTEGELVALYPREEPQPTLQIDEAGR